MAKTEANIRTSTIHYRFRAPSFEFVFQWLLGMGSNGGSEVGECFYAASQVKENDPESWVRAFASLAQSVKKKAEEYQQGLASRLQQTQAVDRNPDPRSKLIVTTAAEGADALAMSTNMSLMAQLVFD